MARPTRSAAARSSEKVKLLFSSSGCGAVDDDQAVLNTSDSDLSESVSFIRSPSVSESIGTDEDEIVSLLNNGSNSELVRVLDVEDLASVDNVHDDSSSGVAFKIGYHAHVNRKRSRRKMKDTKRTTKLDWEIWEEANIRNDSTMKNAEYSMKRTMQMIEPSPDILVPLLPFQKEWLWWSLQQELSDVRGGILADEMGMGKTIQAISLILTSRSQKGLQSGSPSTSSLDSGGPSVEKRQIKGTLVICPLVAVTHWKDEVAKFTREGSVKVLTYHGTKRLRDVDELAKADIVLTTYSIVESEYRTTTSSDKLRCKWCRRLFESDRLVVHQRYFCGPHAQKTEKQAKQGKKKSVKSNNDYVLDLNGDPMDTSSKNVSVGGSYKRKFRKLDLNVAVSEDEESFYVDDSRKANAKGFSALHAVKWNRIVLDEAHCIKDRKSSTAKSVFALCSNFRWALSGTPLQNRVGELYSLIRFLEIKPFSYYYCKLCDCKSLDYCFKGGQKCSQCEHSAPSHFCWWNKQIANPIKRCGYVREGCDAMKMLKQKLLGDVLLRRTKSERAADLALPPSSKYLRRDRFDAKEEDFYQALYTQSQSQFNTYIDSGTLMNNYAHIFDLLTRLRQAVDHPYLVVYSKTSREAPIQYADAGPNDEVCSICREQFEEPYVTDCNHTYCKSCIMDYVSTAVGKPPCPMCQKPLTVDFTSSKASTSTRADNFKSRGIKSTSILRRIDVKQFQTSTKIEALREEIAEMLERDCAAKAIVFSQFTSFLELISFQLQKFGVKCVKLDGSMSLSARDQMIDKFTNDPDCKVFLMSLKAGGVALNLTVASHVFLMDPWWNPAVEQQAQDRIHRLGQYKPIRVVRFVIENTIEERILKLQEKKQLVFEGTVGGSSEALGKLTENDLRFLFTS